MLKSEMERMVKIAGGELSDQEIVYNGQTFKIGQIRSTTMTVSCTEVISEIVAFGPPAARGRIDKYDDWADAPSVIIRKSGHVHPSAEYEIKMVLDF